MYQAVFRLPFHDRYTPSELRTAAPWTLSFGAFAIKSSARSNSSRRLQITAAGGLPARFEERLSDLRNDAAPGRLLQFEGSPQCFFRLRPAASKCIQCA